MANLQGMMKIISIKNIANDVYEMVLEGEGAKYISAPGQFINIKINDLIILKSFFFWKQSNKLINLDRFEKGNFFWTFI